MLLDNLLRSQSTSGAFPSYIQVQDERLEDENCFITSLVLLELLRIPPPYQSQAWQDAIQKGIHFIKDCEEATGNGKFNFYPYTLDTPRLPIAASPDFDDSALALLVLLKQGERDAAAVRTIIRDVFEPYRIISTTSKDPAWVQPGLFRTWIDTYRYDNPVDCCVNLNMLCLYQQVFSGDTAPGALVHTAVSGALKMYGTSTSAMRRISPYYAHVAELYFCLERAGYALPADDALLVADRPICCNISGRPLWYAPVLQQARAIGMSLTSLKMSTYDHH